MSDYIWRGPRRLEPGKERLNFTADAITLEQPYSGPFELCVAERPPIGSVMTEWADLDLRVVSVAVERLDGDAGTMTVFAESPQASEANYSTAAIGEPQYELDFQPATLKLWQHPRCGNLTDEALAAGVGWDDLDKLKNKNDYYFTPDLPPHPFYWSLKQYLDMRGRGVEDYETAFPVVRRTTYHFAKPTDVGEGCFERENPPVFANLGGTGYYKWIKGTDRAIKQGRVYARTTEWLGYLALDPDLYPTGS